MQYRKSFNDTYAFGLIAESQIAQWLIRAKQYNILPAYEIEIPSGKGPRLLTRESVLISPDMLASRVIEKGLDVRWIEAKHKKRFTWHHNSGNWQTGIDLRHYRDYIEVQRQTKIPVYILFMHQSATPSQSDLSNGSPKECPTGLFCNSLRELVKHKHHEGSFDSYPMVYWNHSNLIPLASLEEIEQYSRKQEVLA